MQSMKKEKHTTPYEENIDFRDITTDLQGGEINELAVVIEGEEKTTWFVWILVSLKAGIS